MSMSHPTDLENEKKAKKKARLGEVVFNYTL